MYSTLEKFDSASHHGDALVKRLELYKIDAHKTCSAVAYHDLFDMTRRW